MLFSSHGLLRLSAPTLILCAMMTSGCAATGSTLEQMSAQIERTTDAFYTAIVQKDADTVYEILDPDWRSQFADKAEFKDYFHSHYESFAGYAEALRDDSRPIQFSAQIHGDPCAGYQIVPDSNELWKISRFADTFEDETTQKNAVLTLIKTGRFRQSLEAYSNLHPELSNSDLRQILRVLAFDEIAPEHLEFTTNHIILTIPHTARIRMVCEDSKWSIAECSALP